MKVKISVFHKEHMIKEETIVHEKITIGRSEENSFVIDESFVSKKHCEISKLGYDKILVKDLGSRNGLIYEGRVNPEFELEKSGTFQIGEYFINIDILPNLDSTVSLNIKDLIGKTTKAEEIKSQKRSSLTLSKELLFTFLFFIFIQFIDFYIYNYTKQAIYSLPEVISNTFFVLFGSLFAYVVVRVFSKEFLLIEHVIFIFKYISIFIILKFLMGGLSVIHNYFIYPVNVLNIIFLVHVTSRYLVITKIKQSYKKCFIFFSLIIFIFLACEEIFDYIDKENNLYYKRKSIDHKINFLSPHISLRVKSVDSINKLILESDKNIQSYRSEFMKRKKLQNNSIGK